MVGSSAGGDLRTLQFNGTNYDIWAVKMKTILIAFDLWDVVEVILPEVLKTPEVESGSTGEGSDEHILEEKQVVLGENKIKNIEALSLIQGALSDDLIPRIRNEKNCKRSMRDIQKRV